MKGFETDKWIFHNYEEFKHAQHKDFPFIKINFDKIQKSSDSGSVTWKVSLTKWGGNKKIDLNVFYKKFTKDKVPEVFDKIMTNDDAKFIILNYLFEAPWL